MISPITLHSKPKQNALVKIITQKYIYNVCDIEVRNLALYSNLYKSRFINSISLHKGELLGILFLTIDNICGIF